MAIIRILEEKINQKKDEINLFFIKKYQQFSGKTLYNSISPKYLTSNGTGFKTITKKYKFGNSKN